MPSSVLKEEKCFSGERHPVDAGVLRGALLPRVEQVAVLAAVPHGPRASRRRGRGLRDLRDLLGGRRQRRALALERAQSAQSGEIIYTAQNCSANLKYYVHFKPVIRLLIFAYRITLPY